MKHISELLEPQRKMLEAVKSGKRFTLFMPRLAGRNTFLKALCVIGYHSWTWTLKRDGFVTEPVTGEIPDRAVCARCGEKYKK